MQREESMRMQSKQLWHLVMIKGVKGFKIKFIQIHMFINS
jgi:hypothetical protein